MGDRSCARGGSALIGLREYGEASSGRYIGAAIMAKSEVNQIAAGAETPGITALIVDDEPLAREGIVRLLATTPDIHVVARCASGRKAVTAIGELRPDLVFLDVQMPGMTGFDVIREVGPDRMPFVVFTTAYDEYAVKAFEANAVEYLLKPFSDERFAEAVNRARRAVRLQRLSMVEQSLVNVLARVDALPAGNSTEPGPRRLAVRSAGKTVYVPVNDVDWIEGADYYAGVHTGGRVHLVRESLGSLASRLDRSRFLRVHRSAIVNVDRVREIRTTAQREAIAVLTDGTRIRLARGSRALLENLLEGRAEAEQ